MNNKKDRHLPLRTLHEFLYEISSEWDRFRTGSLLSIITTLILFFLFIPRYFLITLRRGGPFDTIIVVCIIITFFYSIYLSYKQHEFYKKWEKRMGLLIHMEEEILGEDF
jgi:hypothetical protein